MSGHLSGLQDSRKSKSRTGPQGTNGQWLVGPGINGQSMAGSLNLKYCARGNNCRAGHQWLDGPRNNDWGWANQMLGLAGPQENHGCAQVIRNAMAGPPEFRKFRISMAGPKSNPWLGNDRNESSPLKTMIELKYWRSKCFLPAAIKFWRSKHFLPPKQFFAIKTIFCHQHFGDQNDSLPPTFWRSK